MHPCYSSATRRTLSTRIVLCALASLAAGVLRSLGFLEGGRYDGGTSDCCTCMINEYKYFNSRTRHGQSTTTRQPSPSRARSVRGRQYCIHRIPMIAAYIVVDSPVFSTASINSPAGFASLFFAGGSRRRGPRGVGAHRQNGGLAWGGGGRSVHAVGATGSPCCSACSPAAAACLAPFCFYMLWVGADPVLDAPNDTDGKLTPYIHAHLSFFFHAWCRNIAN